MLAFLSQLVEQGVDFVGLLQHGNEDETASRGKGSSGQQMQSSQEAEEDIDEALGKMTDDEERVTGAVEWRVYKQYLLGCGGVAFLMFLLVISIVLEVRLIPASLPLIQHLLTACRCSGLVPVHVPLVGLLVESCCRG